jgi:WS/DGAT/MGAT family acyltransferase
VVTKTHPVLVDGLSALDIGHVLLDETPEVALPAPEPWQARPAPGRFELALQAVEELAVRPTSALGAVRGALTDVRSTAGRAAGLAGGVLRAARSAAFAAPASPLNATVGARRRVAVARVDLGDVKKVRTAHGGTVNDVLLTVVTGALREWLLSRGQPVVGGTSVRALVPVSIEDDAAPGGTVASHLVDLPVGEPNPRVRLARIGYAMRSVGSGVGADALAALSGFAPPTLHALGVRAARGLSRRLFNLVVTNVPGPQVPLYAAGGRVLEVFPVVPLVRGQGLSIGMTSYDGRVYVGLNADAESVGDVDLLADLVEEELGELLAVPA